MSFMFIFFKKATEKMPYQDMLDLKEVGES